MADDFLTMPEAAALLHVSRRTLLTYRQTGTLPAYKVGPRRVLLKRSDVLALLVPERPAETPSGELTPEP